MKKRMLVMSVLALAMLIPKSAAAKDKKKPPRGMIESMQSLPCGMKEKGLNGLGAVWGSVGITSVSSNEKLCPQYLFRTDDLEYHIRPKDTKHPVILPIGHEAEYRIHKDEIILKVPEGDKKTRAYHVVSMEPISGAGVQSSQYRDPAPSPASQPSANTPAARPAMPPAEGSSSSLPQRAVNQNTAPPPSQPVPPPQ